eukprot:CAMPEP_0172907544 /NCGR_PEP_ID=MMETSP1075-20121228/179045_1 /TAXON_ID=2916 /ORGANISM="Ceratium fusus, Strain PA161109" /LENGTH=407 /DNA_ID=CAMNT_0013765181 /DNA_START=36 /DNA_END=1262 /DNA_ORIENTATION=+
MTDSGHALLRTTASPGPRRNCQAGLCGFLRKGILAGTVLVACVVLAGLQRHNMVFAMHTVLQPQSKPPAQRSMMPEAKYAGWTSTTAGVESANPAAACPDAQKLSAFSSRESMEKAGWRFGWDDGNTFKPIKSSYGRNVSNQSYWGFSSLVDAEIALVLHGQGQLTLDFGNSYNEERSTGAGNSVSRLAAVGPLSGPIRMLERPLQSQVSVFLNGEYRGRARMRMQSTVRRIPFKSGDVLRLVETNGVIVINSIAFDCASISSVHSGTTTFFGHTSSTTLMNTITGTRETVSTKTDALDADKLPGKNEWLAVKQRHKDLKSDRQQALALADVERLKHRAQELRRSESMMSAKLARTAKQLRALEKQELQEIRAAKAEKERQQMLLQQINKASNSSSLVTSEVMMRYS